jgi:hypothetical protein
MASPGNAGTLKLNCPKCGRTVFSVLIEADRVLVDAEVITVIPYRTNDQKIVARRSHSELCMRYALERDLKAARAAKAKRK